MQRFSTFRLLFPTPYLLKSAFGSPLFRSLGRWERERERETIIAPALNESLNELSDADDDQDQRWLPHITSKQSRKTA